MISFTLSASGFNSLSSIILFKRIPTLTLLVASSAKVSFGNKSSLISLGSIPILLAVSCFMFEISESIIAEGTSNSFTSINASKRLCLTLPLRIFSKSSSSLVRTSVLKDSTSAASIPALLKNSSLSSGNLGDKTSFTSVSKETGFEASSFFP